MSASFQECFEEIQPGSLKSTWSPSAFESYLKRVFGDLVRKGYSFTDEELVCTWVRGCPFKDDWFFREYASVLAARKQPLPVALHEALAQLPPTTDSYRKSLVLAARNDSWAGEAVVFRPGDAWGRRAAADLNHMDEAERGAFRELAALAMKQGGAKPSKAFRFSSRGIVETIDPRRFEERLRDWVEALGPKETKVQVTEHNGTVLRGLLWSVAELPGASIDVLLGDAAVACLRKIPGAGAVCARVGNGCLVALAARGTMSAVTQLSRVGRRVPYERAQSLVREALETAAEKAGVSQRELEELALPTLGLDPTGSRVERLGDFTFHLRIRSTGTELLVSDASGKRVKIIPDALKESHGEELKELKQAKKELDDLLPVQRLRLEELFTEEREWALADWRERYLEHPLMGGLSRRLIWRFTVGDRVTPGFCCESGQFVGSSGAPFTLRDTARVSIWHPLGEPLEVVAAWRKYLVEHGVTQPFKQAHREIYVVTDAERETRTYSNRFAGHILRQHTLAALCSARGWRMKLFGQFDGGETPSRVVPSRGLTVYCGLDNQSDEQSEAGIALFVTTGGVRVGSLQESTELETLPPRVFSEVMRDVDLFVGVASVGTDPTWHDRGRIELRNYWAEYAKAPLGESAKIRRAVLSELIPKMPALRDVAIVEGVSLRVRGKLRSYAIHLGSGNVLMEPNSQYLCIVPRTGRSEPDVSLPFEGDAMLSLILSKAVMLAADDKIKDPSIKSQLRGR